MESGGGKSFIKRYISTFVSIGLGNCLAQNMPIDGEPVYWRTHVSL